MNKNYKEEVFGYEPWWANQKSIVSSSCIMPFFNYIIISNNNISFLF